MYFWDTKSLQPQYILMLHKLQFLWHLVSLPETSLAKEVYNLQKGDKNLPSLVNECELHLEELDIHIDPASVTKKEWKKVITSKIHQKNKDSLLLQIQSSRKLDIETISSEDYEEKSYLRNMRISQGRTFFSSRSSCLSTVQWNFKNNPKYRSNGYLCRCKEHIDTQSSLLNCRLYDHLKDGLDPSNSDIDLVRFFQLVIQERLKEEEDNDQSQ